MTESEHRPEVLVKPSAYQPTKSELEEDVRIEASPEDVIRAAFSQIKNRPSVSQ